MWVLSACLVQPLNHVGSSLISVFLWPCVLARSCLTQLFKLMKINKASLKYWSVPLSYSKPTLHAYFAQSMYKKVFLYHYTLYMIGLLCSSRKNPYPPHGRSLEIPRGRGVLKVKILEAKYEAKLEFPGGGREGAKQKPSVKGSMDISWNCTFLLFPWGQCIGQGRWSSKFCWTSFFTYNDSSSSTMNLWTLLVARHFPPLIQ